jgi:hypothetical protein
VAVRELELVPDCGGPWAQQSLVVAACHIEMEHGGADKGEEEERDVREGMRSHVRDGDGHIVHAKMHWEYDAKEINVEEPIGYPAHTGLISLSICLSVLLSVCLSVWTN